MPATATNDESMEFGPAMRALTEQQRRFVLAMYEAPNFKRSGVFAATKAGYGTASSSRQTIAQMAYQLKCDPKIQAAIVEVAAQFFNTLGPLAVSGALKVLSDTKHREYGRVLGLVMDRVAPVTATSVVKVEGEVKLTAAETANVLDRIEELAARFAVKLPAPKVIDHEAVA